MILRHREIWFCHNSFAHTKRNTCNSHNTSIFPIHDLHMTSSRPFLVPALIFLALFEIRAADKSTAFYRCTKVALTMTSVQAIYSYESHDEKFTQPT